MEKVRKVVILRGVSGAGKSTFVATYFPGATVCSADDFFMLSGEYRFDPTKLPAAHQACWRKFFAAVNRGDELIVIDNTNIRVTEISPYVLPAEAMDYEVEIIEIDTGVSTAHRRNLHGVGFDAVARMDRDLQAHTAFFPPWWKHTVVGALT